MVKEIRQLPNGDFEVICEKDLAPYEFAKDISIELKTKSGEIGKVDSSDSAEKGDKQGSRKRNSNVIRTEFLNGD